MSKIKTYRKQETILTLLNISVLAALFVTHIGFISLLGRPTSLLLATLSLRFIILIFELIWIQNLTPETNPRLLLLHTHFSVWLNIGFAFAASYFGGTADSHYWVLMVIPIITAAYRFNLARTLAIVAVAIILTVLAVWLYFQRHPPAEFTEYFESATVSLIFLVVGLVVWLLVGNLRTEETKLQLSLDKLKQMQEKLLADEKLAAIGYLSSAIAHEIRNPVAMIASSLQMAERQPPDSPVRGEMFDIALAESKRLESLTTDFLSYARTKAAESKPTDVSELLEYVGSAVKARLAEKHLKLRLECNENLQAEIDGSQLQQALLNLLMNAIQSAPESSTIMLGASLDEEYLVLSVENEGDTIAPQVAPNIFEPFFTAKPKGTGLGLSIVRNIARSHGGDVCLAKNDHSGVRFEIRLPGERG